MQLQDSKLQFLWKMSKNPDKVMVMERKSCFYQMFGNIVATREIEGTVEHLVKIPSQFKDKDYLAIFVSSQVKKIK